MDPFQFLPSFSLGTFAPLLLWPFYGIALVLASIATALGYLLP